MSGQGLFYDTVQYHFEPINLWGQILAEIIIIKKELHQTLAYPLIRLFCQISLSFISAIPNLRELIYA